MKLRDPLLPILVAIALWLAIASCGAGLAAGAARSAADVATAKAKDSAAAAGVAITPLPAPANTKDADAQLAHWKQVAQKARDDQADAEGRERAANGQITAVTKEREALVLEAWRTRLAWSAGLMLVGILAGVALEFVLPAPLRGWATRLIAACSAVAVAAWILRAVLPWLTIAAELGAWALVAGVVAFAIRWVWKLKHTATQASAHGDRMEEVAAGAIAWMDAEAGDAVRQSIDEAKTLSAKAQQSAGVATIMAHLRGKDPAKAAAAAVKPAPTVLPSAAPSRATAPTEILPALPPAPSNQG